MMKNSLERLERREAKKEMINKQSIFTTHVLIFFDQKNDSKNDSNSGSNNANNNNTNNNSSNTINIY